MFASCYIFLCKLIRYVTVMFEAELSLGTFMFRTSHFVSFTLFSQFHDVVAPCILKINTFTLFDFQYVAMVHTNNGEQENVDDDICSHSQVWHSYCTVLTFGRHVSVKYFCPILKVLSHEIFKLIFLF
jgi:hypothetical protein